jgi:hypothetical protein
MRAEGASMTGSRRPAFASDDWMMEQQLRAELEAEAWRRLREQLAVPPQPAPALAAEPAAPAVRAAPDFHRGGSAVLKALVRFGLAAFFAYLAYLAAVDSGLGEFEIWLAIGSTFLVVLALSMFGAARQFVHVLAETMRWVIIVAAGLGAVWLMVQMSA